MWKHVGQSTAMAVAKDTVGSQIFGLPLRLFTPVWLLDGLDEAPIDLGERGFWERIAALPGEAVATCRTAVFQPVRPEAAGLIGQEYRIIGLKPQEQSTFLAKALEAEHQNPAQAAELVRKLNANPSLRPLAAIPLLLRLVAQAAGRLVLPHSRAGFYEEATNALWHRRLRDHRALYDLAVARDAALATLAGKMRLDKFEASLDLLNQANVTGELRKALRQSGLLQFNDRRLSAVFPHLSFQEFHLARSWQAQDFAEMLDKHWADTRYHEVLGLLVALHWQVGRARAVEATLRAFTDGWRTRHTKDPTELWSIGHSPYAAVMALLGRGGVAPTDPLMGAAAKPAIRWKLVLSPNIPAAACILLAKDADAEVRRRVAVNSATPPESLALLAKDCDTNVRRTVSMSAAIPPESLRILAKDPDAFVRRMAAFNPVIPPDSLALLAEDADAGVRGTVAQNFNAPPESLALLAKDADAGVRRTVAQNFNAPPESLALLAKDSDESVRSAAETSPWRQSPLTSVAKEAVADPETPPDNPALLVRHSDADVRYRLAKSAATPPDHLALLATDVDKFVRREVAENSGTPPESLTLLAQDADAEVRRRVARNSTIPLNILTLLSKDSGAEVRRRVAWNAVPPPDLLALLAKDPDAGVRSVTAENAATPLESLALIARDPSAAVRADVARSAATPPNLLALLATDPDENVRRQAAENPATLFEDLWLLIDT